MTGLTLTLAAEANPVGHVVNHLWLKIDGWWVWTSNQSNLVLAGLIMLVLGPWIAHHVGTGPEEQGHDRYLTRSRFAHMVEVICVYLRDATVRPLLGRRTDAFMPFLWTLFFFILISNLLGLVPLLDVNNIIAMFAAPDVVAEHRAIIGGTATQNLFVTGILAVMAALVFNLAGVKELGVGGYLRHLTGGAPAYIWPILVPVEILGILVKPFALAVRLFANMTAGHILVASLFMFVMLVWDKSWALKGPVTLVSAVGAFAIYFLEIFVAFVQAFIFMFLTAVFISMLSHHGEHDAPHEPHTAAAAP